MKRSSPNKNTFVCKYIGCQKRFKNEQLLNKHDAQHTQYNTYVCFICHQPMTISAYLKKHIKEHTNAILFYCTEPGCGRAFTLADKWLIHKHWHERQYTSDVSSYTGMEEQKKKEVAAVAPHSQIEPQPQVQSQELLAFFQDFGNSRTLPTPAQVATNLNLERSLNTAYEVGYQERNRVQANN